MQKYKLPSIRGHLLHKVPFPQKIATKGFSTDLSSIGCLLLHIKSTKKSNFRKVFFFQDGRQTIKITQILPS